MILIKKIKSNRLLWDSYWTVIGNALGKGLSVLGGMIIAAILGKDVFGEYGLIKNTLLMIAIFSTMGLGYTSTIFVAKYNNSDESSLYPLIKNILRVTLLFSSGISLLVLIFSNQIANYLEDSSLAYSLKFLSVIIIFNALTTSQIGILAGFKMFKETAIVNITSGVINFGLSIFLTYIWGFNGALLALALTQFFNCGFNNLFIRKKINLLNRNGTVVMKGILKQSLPIALQEMSVSIFHWIGYLMLLKLTNYGEIGIYSAATQWSTIILFIPVTLRNVVLSHLSTQQSHVKHTKILFSMMGVFTISTLFPATLVLVFSKYIVLFYGDTFWGLKPVLITCCYSTVFNSIYNVFSSDFMSRNKNWIIYAITLGRDISIIICFYIMIKVLKINGAYSMALATFCIGIITIIVCFLFFFDSRKQDNNV